MILFDQVIKRGGMEATTLDLDDYDNIGCYVRFYITGEMVSVIHNPLLFKKKIQP